MILTESTVNWLIYALALGTNAVSCALINDYKTPSGVLAADPDALVNLGRLPAESARRLLCADDRKALEIMALCRDFNWQILTPDHACYPARLRELPDFPLVLFARGDPALLKAPLSAAVVGTRRPSAAGLDYAFRLAACFSENGVVTVSGCAVGVDTAAHEGGLTARGSTVAVLGNGFGFNYLPEQVFLRRRIEKYGLLLTETLPFRGPASYSFQRRNRLISALSGGVTVVESGKTGGSLITAAFARKQGRPLFVPPVSAVDPPGCRQLRGEGAAQLADPAVMIPDAGNGTFAPPAYPLDTPRPLPDFLDPASQSLSSFALHNEITPQEAEPVFRLQPKRRVRQAEVKPAPEPRRDLFAIAASAAQEPKAAPQPPEKAGQRQAAPLPAGLTQAEAAVFGALTSQPVLLDDLAAALGMDAPLVMNTVSVLELRGLAATYPGNRASRAAPA